MITLLRPWLLVLALFSGLAQASSAALTGTKQDCTWSALIWKIANGAYEGSATITSYTGPGGAVTWPKSPAFRGSYAGQTSADLVEWTDVTENAVQVTKNSDSVIWKRPTGPSKCFVRLLVMPN